MTILPIVTFPDKKLLLVSEEVLDIKKEQIKSLVQDMIETMHANHGMGLAAVQVGVNKRVFVVDIHKSYKDDFLEVEGFSSTAGPLAIVNPRITYLSEEKISLEEGCLSLPSQQAFIVRPKLLILEYLNLEGQNLTLKASGWLSRCCQHEIDHLNGKLFIHLLSKLRYNMILSKLKKKSKIT